MNPASGQQRFHGKVALVTGAGSGLGCAIAHRLAAEGASVAVLDIDLDAARETADELTDAGLSASAFGCDVTREKSVQAAHEAVERQFGGVDVVIPNAGIAGPVGKIPDLSLEDWNNVVAVNLTGVFLTAKYAIPALRRRGGGAIVITASNASIAAEPLWAAYGATKGGVLALTRGLGIDHAAEGIRVTCVCPGPIDTPLLRRGYATQLGAELVEDMSIPLPVPAARAAEVAGIVAFLASDEAASITAVGLVADGGSSSQLGAGFGQATSGLVV